MDDFDFIDEFIEALHTRGVNSKQLVLTRLESLTLDDLYQMKNQLNVRINKMKAKGYRLETNPNVLLLRTYKNELYEYKRLENEIAKLSNFVKAPSYSFTPPQVSSRNTILEQHIALLEAKEKLEILAKNKALKMVKCAQLVEKITNPKARLVVHKLYIEGYSLIEVFNELDISYSHIKRLRDEGLAEVRKIPLDNG